MAFPNNPLSRFQKTTYADTQPIDVQFWQHATSKKRNFSFRNVSKGKHLLSNGVGW